MGTFPLGAFVDLSLGHDAQIDGFDHPLFQTRAHQFENPGVFRIRGQVPDHVWIAFGIVKFLDRFEAHGRHLHGAGEFSGPGEFHPLHENRRSEFVVLIGFVWQVRVEITLVAVAFVADGADHLKAAVKPVTVGDHVVALFGIALTEQCPAVHVAGGLDSGEFHHRRPHVHEADHVVEHRAGFRRPTLSFVEGGEMLVLLRVTHNQRHVGPLLPGGVLASRHAHPVIRPDDDNGVLP